MRTAVYSILATLLAASLPGCINADPSTFPGLVDGGAPVTRPDVMRDTPEDVDPRSICRACLAAPEDPGPGCEAANTACVTDEKCNIVYECAFRLDCLSLPTQVDIINCSIGCFGEAGITSPTHPSVALATAITTCVLGQCQPACGVSP